MTKALEQSQKEYQSRHISIALDRNNYEDLKLLGQVPETFNDIIRRLLKEKQPIIRAIRQAKGVSS